MVFIPKRVLIEAQALNYDLGQQLRTDFGRLGIPVNVIKEGGRVTGIPGKTGQEAFFEAKRTLVIGVRTNLKFQSCKPSAHYQLPLTSSCPGKCEYCYLMTNFGKRPYLKAYVNLEEILAQAEKLMETGTGKTTIFEGAATSDPIPVDRYTKALATSIEFFGKQKKGRFRFVTKFNDIDHLLSLDHQGHTTFRFSLNTDAIVRNYEHGTPSVEERLIAAVKVAEAGYPYGFIIGPIIIYPGWEEDYHQLINKTAAALLGKPVPRFELITHRFTVRAKNRILDVYPNTTLPLEEGKRRFKFGQFGYGKYLYKVDEMEKLQKYLRQAIETYFPDATVDYFV